MKGRQLLVNFIKEHAISYIAGILILWTCCFVAMTLPKIIGTITDGLNRKDMPQQQILHYVLLMILVAVSIFILKFLWRYFLIGNCRSLECYLRDHLFKHLQTLPVSFYNNRKTGDLVAYAINDVQAVRITMGFGTVHILDGIAVGTISVIFMAKTINPVLTLMALAPVPIAVTFMVLLGKLIRARFKKVQEAFAIISDKVQESISGIRVIKAFAQEDEEVESFLKYSRQRVDTQMKLTKVSALLGPSSQICFGISFLFFIIYGSKQVMDGVITLGDYVAFNSYMLAIMGPVTSIGRVIDVWQRGIASYKRLGEIFDLQPAAGNCEGNCEEAAERMNVGDELETCSIRGNIEFRNLNFTYPGARERALKNINLLLGKGQTLGVLGKTGSGKTTLVNLLLKLYEVGEGHILIDGKDINDIPADVLRECIGCVPQENFLFSATIRNNIEFFRNDYSDEEVEQAARLSGVYDNIVAFPEGFSTVVGERGVMLSGGQKQRISIARALIKNPSILILDDSLSAVDTKTEEEILGNIKELLQNRTGIIISHRVSTVKHADEIVFMDGGRIMERGSHEQLMELRGQYFTLYKAQTDTEQSREEVLDA